MITEEQFNEIMDRMVDKMYDGVDFFDLAENEDDCIGLIGTLSTIDWLGRSGELSDEEIDVFAEYNGAFMYLKEMADKYNISTLEDCYGYMVIANKIA